MIIIDNNIWPREYTINEFKLQYPNVPQTEVIHLYKMKHKQFVDNQHQQLLQQQQILEYQEKCEQINLESNWLCGTESSPGGSYAKPRIIKGDTDVTNETEAGGNDGQIKISIDMRGAISSEGLGGFESPYYYQLYIFAGVGITGSYGNGVHQESSSFGNLPPDNKITQNIQNITWTGLRDGEYYMDVYNRNLDVKEVLIRTDAIEVGTAE